MTRWIAWGATAGLVLPLTFWLAAWLQDGVFPWPQLVVTLWPSSILLFATEAFRQPWWWTPLTIALSVGLNVVLYAIIGAALGFVVTRLRRATRRST
jgi:hypothetical protein